MFFKIFSHEKFNIFRSFTLFDNLAKIHCVADIDSIRDIYHTDEHTTLLPLHIIPKNTEHAIRDAIGGRDEDFIQDMIRFAMV